MKVSVVCGLCNTHIEYEEKQTTLYGSVPVDDFGCIEVTHTSPEITEHMTKHTWDEKLAALLRKYDYGTGAAKALRARFEPDEGDQSL